jgi:hypothetical protein
MNEEQKDPELIFKDIVTDIVTNHIYESYTRSNEWEEFFNAMKLLSDQIIKKIIKKEEDLKDSQRKFVYEQAEKDDFKRMYSEE